MALKKGDDRLTQLRDVFGAARAHHDAIRVPGPQRGCAFGLCRGFADVVDLVEHQETRHAIRPDLLEHVIGNLKLSLEPGIAGIDDVEQQRCIQRFLERGT